MDLPPLTPKPARGALAPETPKPLSAPAAASEAAARETARAFEAAFLAEMLKHSGVNRTPDALGGGAGEDAFGSFLTEEYAKKLTERGGIGLAEQIFNAIHQKGSDQ